ncbi:hypothetical protein ACOSQ2_028824 [Xanthoceras sorbifolium]
MSTEFKPFVSVGNNTFLAWGRKLLNSGGGTEANGQCSKDDIKIIQGTLPPQPSGIPTYRVEIINTCAIGCAIGDIKVYCGGFTSANLINPTIFKHLPNEDFCLVNNGAPLKGGAMVSFIYTTTFMYKSFSVSSVTCPSS